MTKGKDEKTETLVADNRKAGHDYHLLEQFEAGVVLDPGHGSQGRA